MDPQSQPVVSAKAKTMSQFATFVTPLTLRLSACHRHRHSIQLHGHHYTPCIPTPATENRHYTRLSRPGPTVSAPCIHASQQKPEEGVSSDSDNNVNAARLAALTEEQRELLPALRDKNSTRQILALLNLPKLDRDTALTLLLASDALKSKVPKQKIAALDTLGKLRIPTQCPFLVDVLQTDDDHSVRAAAAAALSSTLSPSEHSAGPANGVSGGGGGGREGDGDSVRGSVVEALRYGAKEDEHFIVRYSCIVALGNVRDASAVPMLMTMVETLSTPPLEAAAAIDAIGEIVMPDDVREEWLQAIRARCADKEDLVRAAVARTLEAWRSVPGVNEAMVEMLRMEGKYGRSSFVLASLRLFIGEDGEGT